MGMLRFDFWSIQERNTSVIKEDGGTLRIADDRTDRTNMFKFKFYEEGSLKNSKLYITARNFKRGESAVALSASPQKWWFNTKSNDGENFVKLIRAYFDFQQLVIA